MPCSSVGSAAAVSLRRRRQLVEDETRVTYGWRRDGAGREMVVVAVKEGRPVDVGTYIVRVWGTCPQQYGMQMQMQTQMQTTANRRREVLLGQRGGRGMAA